MYKKGMRRAAALLAVCWLGLLFRAAAETPAEKLERLRAEQQAIEQQIEQNRTDAARAGDLVNLYTAKEQNVKAQIAVLQLKIQECEAQLAGTQAQVAAKLLEVDRSTQSWARTASLRCSDSENICSASRCVTHGSSPS